ncbi:MAG: DMT family transporter [Pseudomonadota bacterium]|nr:DMT family transporter [Pseudomonadota bacterium]
MGSTLPEQDAFKGGLYMAVAMAAFTLNDTLVKLVGGDLPVGTLVFVRGAFACALLMAAVAWSGALAQLPKIFSGGVALRASLDTAATLLFISALMVMPIAELTSISQAAPLVSTGLAVLFLGERIGWRRALAIVTGFLGVLLIVRPQGKMEGVAGIAIVLVLTIAMRDVVTRRISGGIAVLVVALANGLYVVAGAGILSLFESGLRVPSAYQTACLAAAGAFLALGYYFMVKTLRYASIASTAPFRYTVVLWSLLSGAAVFAERPDALAGIGIVLIVASGLYALFREAMLRRRQSAVDAVAPSPARKHSQ